MVKVSYSRISCYLDCQQKHYYKYVEGLRAKKIARPLVFGKDFHSLLENREHADEIFDAIEQTYYEMPSIVQAELGDCYIDDLKTIYEDYCEVWKGAVKPIETEHEFLLPIAKYKGEEVLFHGFIDEIYEDNALGEHKTFSYKPDMSLLAMNMQICLYAKAMSIESGKMPTKVRWDYIRSTPAKMPIWLEKSGRFSDASNSNITNLSWLRACKERGIKDKSILAKAKDYEPNISNYFFRCDIEILPSMADMAWNSFSEVTKEIITKGGGKRVKNISKNCAWCEYQPICYAEFTGADVDYVLSTDYEREDK